MALADAEQFHPQSLDDWHAWLATHHDRGTGVWVVTWRATSGRQRLSYDELVREALCWGWVDGQAAPLDDQRSKQWFTKRKPGSPWAASNKARVAELEREGRLQPSGAAEIERAKATGAWTLLDSVEALAEPADLTTALDASAAARTVWDGFPPGVRKQALGWVALAKRAQTRASRIEAIVAKAERGERPA